MKQDIEKSIKRYKFVTMRTAELAAQVRSTGTLSFQTSTERYDIDLVPHDLRAPNYRAEEVGVDGRIHPVKSGPVRTFKGTVRGMDGAQARFTVDERLIEGLILTRSAHYFIEPARKYSASAGPSDYLLYDSADVVESSALGCGVTLADTVGSRVESIRSGEALSKSIQAPASAGAVASSLRVVELATEADYEYVTMVGGSTQANDDILTVMNQVDGIYNTDLGIGFTIVYQHTWATVDDPYTSNSAFGTLGEFRSYWNTNMGSVARDLAHIFSSRSTNDYLGIAYIGVVCGNPEMAYGFSLRINGPMATLAAHEIGHNFGGNHVDNTSSCERSVMVSGIGGAITFCGYSRNEINNFVANHPACLSSITTSCAYVLTSTFQNLGKDGGAGALTVTADGGCNWVATSDAAWISIVGVGNSDAQNVFTGNGSATLNYTVTANSGHTRRGTISVAGQSFSITQAGMLPDCVATPLIMAQPANGTLSATDCASSWKPYPAYADTYSFNGVAGQQIRLFMNAPGFVPYLYLTGPNGAFIGSSNNNAGQNNAFVPHSDFLLTLPVTGMYFIEATSWASNVTGTYTLNLASAPTPTTGTVSSVTTQSAQLNGHVNPNGSATSVWFEWGTGSTLSSFTSTPQQSIGAGNVNLPVSVSLSGLVPQTTYYYRVAATNTTGNTTNITKGSILSFVATANTVQVTVQTNPAGRTFIVDLTTYTSTQVFSWSSGSSHTINTTSPQNGLAGTRYIWSSWSDGGAMSHTVAVTNNTTLTANFGTQYFLTTSAGTGGSASPSSSWYNSGQQVQITATPNTGYVFSGWTGSGSGSYTGANNPASLTIGAPITETATFSQIQAPTATTAAASDVTLSSATLNGSVNPNNSSATGWFEWGTSSNLSSFSNTPSQSVGSGSATVSLSASLNNLAANTAYYFRVAASNGGGTTKGAIQSFTTVLPPMLLTQENTNTAIGFDSVTMVRDPFSILTDSNFSLDRHTRIMLFAVNVELLPGDNASAITVQAEDSQQRIIPLTVEYVGKVPSFDWLTQINLRLPDELANAGDVLVSLSLRGIPSNKVLVRIKPTP